MSSRGLLRVKRRVRRPTSQSASRLLACVYTCESHRDLLERFHDSEPGRLLAASPDTRVIEVYADPTLRTSRVRGHELRLGSEERYDALSLKTQRMIEFCVQTFSSATC